MGFFGRIRDSLTRTKQQIVGRFEAIVQRADDLEMDLTIHFVGWTFQGYVRGYYRMADGKPCMDVSASYFIAMERSRIDELVEILKTFINKTLQEALYLEIHDNVEFRFITPRRRP